MFWREEKKGEKMESMKMKTRFVKLLGRYREREEVRERVGSEWMKECHRKFLFQKT